MKIQIVNSISKVSYVLGLYQCMPYTLCTNVEDLFWTTKKHSVIIWELLCIKSFHQFTTLPETSTSFRWRWWSRLTTSPSSVMATSGSQTFSSNTACPSAAPAVVGAAVAASTPSTPCGPLRSSSSTFSPQDLLRWPQTSSYFSSPVLGWDHKASNNKSIKHYIA